MNKRLILFTTFTLIFSYATIAQVDKTIPIGNQIFINKIRLNYQTVKNTESVNDTIKLYNKSNIPIKYLLNPTTYSYLSISPTSGEIKPQDSTILVCTIDGKKSQDYGGNNLRIPLIVNNNEVSIFATWILLEDFSKLTEKEIIEAPKIDIFNPIFLFDTTQAGKIIHAQFKIKNKGINPLIIRKLKPSCGCTSVKIFKDIILSNEETILTAELNTEGMNGFIEKPITITCNDPSNPVLKIFIKGFVYENK